MTASTLATELGAEIARHQSVAVILGDDPSRKGVIRDGGYRCACGAVFGAREYVPTGNGRGREPRDVGLTKTEHIGEVALNWMQARQESEPLA